MGKKILIVFPSLPAAHCPTLAGRLQDRRQKKSNEDFL